MIKARPLASGTIPCARVHDWRRGLDLCEQRLPDLVRRGPIPGSGGAPTLIDLRRFGERPRGGPSVRVRSSCPRSMRATTRGCSYTNSPPTPHEHRASRHEPAPNGRLSSGRTSALMCTFIGPGNGGSVADDVADVGVGHVDVDLHAHLLMPPLARSGSITFYLVMTETS
jgi:hypothetical protein